MCTQKLHQQKRITYRHQEKYLVVPSKGPGIGKGDEQVLQQTSNDQYLGREKANNIQIPQNCVLQFDIVNLQEVSGTNGLQALTNKQERKYRHQYRTI